MITQVGSSSDGGGFAVKVENPASTARSLTLHHKSTAIAFEVKPRDQYFVQVTDPDVAALCNLGTPTFQLSGDGSDTRVRHVEVIGTPVFSAGGGSLSGAAVVPGENDNKVAITAGGATHWYGCGQKFEISVQIANKTAVTPQSLKVELLDVDGTKIGEASANVKAKGVESFKVATTANVSGRVGQLRARLADASSELGGKLSSHDLLVMVSRTGGSFTFKLTD